MSCDGLYLISLKGRKPQRLLARERLRGARPLLCPPPFLLEPNQTGNTGWKAWRCSQSCLGRLMIPAEAQGAASGPPAPTTGIGSACGRHSRAPTSGSSSSSKQQQAQKQGLGMGEDQTA